MSKKTKRIAKGLGASALAVATIASGLSFGAASASAAPAPAGSLRTVQLISQQGPSTFNTLTAEAFNANENVQVQDVATYSTAAIAQRYGIHLTVRPTGDGRFQLLAPLDLTKNRELCLVSGSRNYDYFSYFLTCADDTGKPTPGTSLKQEQSGALRFTETGSTGKPYLTGRTFNWNRDIKTFATADAPDSSWIGLPDNLGAAYMQLEASGSFDTDIAKKATVSGTAEPDATITLKSGTTTLGTTTAAADGTYSFDVDAPNKGGALALTVTQTIDGKDGGSKDVSLDYGKAVAITGPEDQEEVPAGSTAITGSGEAGSDVQVFDNSGRTPVISTKVRSNGTWSGTATLTAGEHTLEAKQMSKGANTTSASVTVNPGEATVDFTAAGRFDAQDVTKPAVAHGSAPAGSTVILRNSVGTEIGRAVAGADDTYQITIDPTKATSGVNTFSAIVQGDAGNAKTFTLDYGMPAAPVVVTTPAQNGTVEPGTVRFAGTGQADSKIVVRGSVRQVATATVNAQGAWAGNSTVQLDKGSYNLYFDQTSKGGLKRTIQHAFTIGETAPVVTQHTVTSPSADQVLDTLTPEFRGTGHEGATITVRGSSRVVATGTVRNGQWVATTSAASPLAPGEYNLYVDQTVRGTVTGTVRVKFTVSNEAFRELTLSAPAQNANVTVLRPTFVGTATPGAQIRVGSSRTTVATATVGADGTWSATADFDLARGGTYAGLEVKQTLKSGKTSTVSSSFTADRNAQ